MKPVNESEYKVIKAGKDYVTRGALCLPTLLRDMERCEDFIYWLQPTHGDVQDQVACVRINGTLFRTNLKLEKAVFRHIRLTRKFHNEEVLADGTRKLRIPMRLLQQKQKTSIRFMVCNDLFVSVCYYMHGQYLHIKHYKRWLV